MIKNQFPQRLTYVTPLASAIAFTGQRCIATSTDPYEIESFSSKEVYDEDF